LRTIVYSFPFHRLSVSLLTLPLSGPVEYRISGKGNAVGNCLLRID